MSTKITYSDPFYNQILSQKSKFSYSRHVTAIGKSHVQLKKINRPLNFLNTNAKIGTFLVRCNRTGSKASPPGNSPSFGWIKWLLEFLLPVLLPAFKNKVIPLQLLESTLKIVETMIKIVEEVTEEVENIAEEVEEKLPEDSKLKQSLDSVEDIIHKIEDVEEEMMEGTMMQTNTTNEV